MNLAQPRRATARDLARLLAGYYDQEQNHILWVDSEGEVHITPVGNDWRLPPVNSRAARWQLQPFMRGQGCVGRAAAVDTEYVERLAEILRQLWAEDRPLPVEGWFDLGDLWESL